MLALALLSCRNPKSNIELPSLIGDNMVLQQKTDINVWGNATPGTKIDISAGWKADAMVTAGEDGKWSAVMPTPEAGGPYLITLKSKDTTITIINVMIGEVWFCSGQSNMEMPLEGWPPNDTVMYSKQMIASASIPEIRLFNVQKNVSSEPLDNCTGKWEVCKPSTVPQFSATAFFFGKKLYDELHIPIGLIESAWGGTPAEAWMSADALKNAGEFVSEIDAIKESVPLVDEYRKWLAGHEQINIKPAGDDQYKNLSFNDESIPSPGFDDSSWPSMSLPCQFEGTTGDFDGAIWFRKTVEIPESMAGKDLVLSLGPIDDMDCSYFNGKLVGATEVSGFYQADRNYDVPKELVKAGANTIAVRVLDTQGGGGLWGKPGSLKISVKESEIEPLNLDGEWKFQPVAEKTGDKFYIFDISKNDYSSVKRPKLVGSSSPTALYNGMVNPVVKYPVKGAIWYQGEANVGRADQYAKIIPALIQNWRDSWNIKDFPFYFVQIAPYIYSNPDSTDSGFLRDAQTKTLKLTNTGMAVTLDIATVMNIHPPYKKEVGERLANMALSNDYGKEILTYGPVYKSMIVEGRAVKIQFSNIEGGLSAKDGVLSEFEMAGINGKYFKADAKIVNNEVWVTSSWISQPVSVRYCWRNGSTASLFNGKGLPALQFDTKGN